MKNKSKAFIILSLFIAFGSSYSFAASVYLGDPSTGGNLQIPIASGNIYTFQCYIDVTPTEAGPGLYGAGIDVNYNPAYFSLSGTPFYTASNWSAGDSKIIDPSASLTDYVTGNDFAFYVVDNTGKGLSGKISVGTFSLLATANAPNLAWLITTGEYSSSDDFLNYNGVVLDSNINFYGANASAVPIPAAVWLLGSGVVGLVALKRRKKA
jgi:hypothetical protein